MLVDNDKFIKELESLFEASKKRGSIWLTHKRLTHDGEDATMAAPSGSQDSEYPCLVRLTNGKDVNVSTHVLSANLDRFYRAYGTLLKSSMTTLRKRDKKREKQRAEEAAARKRRLMEPIAVEGPKRGPGRRKRQRRIKAAQKQEESLRKMKEREAAKEKA